MVRDELDQVRDTPIAELKLSHGATRVLERMQIVWVAQLQGVRHEDLMQEGVNGDRYADEIRDKLRAFVAGVREASKHAGGR